MLHYLKLVVNMLAPFAALFLLVRFLPKLLLFFFPFVLAYIIACLANPLVLALQRRIRIKRNYASGLITVVVLLAVILMLYLGISWLISMGMDLVQALPHYYDAFLASLSGLSVRYQSLIERLPPELVQSFTDFQGSLNAMITELLSKLANPTLSVSLSAVKSVPSVFINTLVLFLASFCFIREWEQLQLWLRKHMPRMVAGYVEHLKRDLKTIFGSWLVAQFKIMFVVFAVLVVAFLLLGINYAVPLALLTAFLDFLPALGVGFIIWPWIVIELLQGQFMMAFWLGIVYILTQVVRHTLQPKIMGDTMGLPPLWTLLFLYLGFKLYGIAGMIFAVPAGMFLLSLIRYGMFDQAIRSAKELLQAFESIR